MNPTHGPVYLRQIATPPSLGSLVKRGRAEALLIGMRCDLHTRYAIAANF